MMQDNHKAAYKPTIPAAWTGERAAAGCRAPQHQDAQGIDVHRRIDLVPRLQADIQNRETLGRCSSCRHRLEVN